MRYDPDSDDLPFSVYVRNIELFYGGFYHRLHFRIPTNVAFPPANATEEGGASVCIPRNGVVVGVIIGVICGE